MTEQKIFTVTEINLLTKEVLENTFSSIWVQGEISNFKTAVSGHMYFDLKDEESTVSAVLFKGYGKYLDTKLENGLFVTVSANMSVYTKQGRYQLVVTSIKP
ncbi:MAG TPA: exodeoxyribonuclease VII large subunit, partial [Elusimicrobiales bacterium]|nr:exodeoxyribonuclease VII large subunit [Elusimicrobiales bacterium]